ncbi:hypothetical protein [Flavobacterium quisquiliarum]|uniref:Uncharacterized protein n=1 Tax=Flavobacterium quisquiliarum TaxID=1834436 RepID=A0ABV8WDN6_9FLAO|nr:hypothetical protein [Flavobacterium quisquiliarum]MBW1657942.1 hypothetical protein [Flavobacterium quisquiliarum]NWL01000.1 hypothetical protein [Flavobacterium collinsii]
MKKIILIQLILFGLQLTSCAQKNEQSPMSRQIKQYENQPIYRLKIASSLSYVVTINGITTATKNQNAGDDRWFLINNCIPVSGKQDIEVTIFPRMNEKGTQHIPFFENNDFFELEIELTNLGKEPKIVYEYELPQMELGSKSSYKFKDSFKANVPYQLTNWNTGKELTKIDSTWLKNEVLASYKMLKSYFENQQGEQFVILVDNGMYNIAQSAYLDQLEYETMKTIKANFINEEPCVLEELDNYELVISANGKLVSLRRNDGYNMGEGVLRRKYIENGQEVVHIDDVVFYAPQTKSSATFPKLEVIMYQNLEKPFNP